MYNEKDQVFIGSHEGKLESINIPLFGEVVLIVQNGKVERYEIKESHKLK